MNKHESKYFNTAVKMDIALIALLKEKPFDYITVSEICKKAGVNRSTFYLHYETIGDLLDETTRYLLENFFSYFPNNIKSAAFDFSACRLNELVYIQKEYLIPYLRYIRENKELFSTILANNKTLDFENIHKRMFQNIYNPILERFGYPENKRSYIMRYYLNGVIAIVTEWLKDDCGKSIKEIIEIITICIYGLENDLKADFCINNYRRNMK